MAENLVQCMGRSLAFAIFWFGIASAKAAMDQIAPPPPPPASPTALDDASPDIVIAARPRTRPPLRNLVDYYRYYCVDAIRLTGHGRAPLGDPDWQPIVGQDLERLGHAAPGAIAFGQRDDRLGLTVYLKIEQPVRADGLHEEQCALILLGPIDQKAYLAQMSALLRGSPTIRHVGMAEGVAKAPGWKRWLWTGMPSRGSRNWVASPTSGDRLTGWDSFLVVTDRRFYDEYDYIFAELKVREAGPLPLSIMSFNHVSAGR